MAHTEQHDFLVSISKRFPEKFNNVKALDIGSLDINGNCKSLFKQSVVLGIDIGPGPNVHIVCSAADYDRYHAYDTIISSECFEHMACFPEFYPSICSQMKPGTMFVWTCATDPRGEHGTLRSDGGFSAPLMKQYPELCNYYKNVDIKWIDEILAQHNMTVNDTFSNFGYYTYNPGDLYFFGIKR
jgi:hypothetical protein